MEFTFVVTSPYGAVQPPQVVTVTGTAEAALVHPLFPVTTTLYEPLAVAVILCEV
ncbi:MAG: hypothetical protein IPP34_02610 [Bacteroidetes bacterium]|nr:hypothetical protein [Bacteroidota bacterium]